MIEIHGSEEEVKNILEKHFIDEEMFDILKSVKESSTPDEIKEKFEQIITLRENLIKKTI